MYSRAELGSFIAVLVVAEAVAGTLILAGGRRKQVGPVLLIVFHVGQLVIRGVL